MPQNNYIRNLLNIKDQNITFIENGVYDKKIKGKTCKVIDAKLSYIPKYCDKCGIVFESNRKVLIKVLWSLFLVFVK